jgi:hypothetical protein
MIKLTEEMIFAIEQGKWKITNLPGLDEVRYSSNIRIANYLKDSKLIPQTARHYFEDEHHQKLSDIWESQFSQTQLKVLEYFVGSNYNDMDNSQKETIYDMALNFFPRNKIVYRGWTTVEDEYYHLSRKYTTTQLKQNLPKINQIIEFDHTMSTSEDIFRAYSFTVHGPEEEIPPYRVLYEIKTPYGAETNVEDSVILPKYSTFEVVDIQYRVKVCLYGERINYINIVQLESVD